MLYCLCAKALRPKDGANGLHRTFPTEHAGVVGGNRRPRKMLDGRARWRTRGRGPPLPGRGHAATRGSFVVPGELQAPGFSYGVHDLLEPEVPFRRLWGAHVHLDWGCIANSKKVRRSPARPRRTHIVVSMPPHASVRQSNGHVGGEQLHTRTKKAPIAHTRAIGALVREAVRHALDFGSLLWYPLCVEALQILSEVEQQ